MSGLLGFEALADVVGFEWRMFRTAAFRSRSSVSKLASTRGHRPSWAYWIGKKNTDYSFKFNDKVADFEFTGFPPVPPNRLTGYFDAPDSHAAGREVFAGLLAILADD